MEKKIFLILFIVGLAIISALIVFLIFFSTKNSQESFKQNQVCFKEHCFLVELATNDFERARGLMFRSTLAADQGMLFIFDSRGEYPFWMKNTQIPLDIIWLDEDRKVVFINADTAPCLPTACVSINPQKLAKFVLELNGGAAQRIGLAVGDKLSFLLSYYFAK